MKSREDVTLSRRAKANAEKWRAHWKANEDMYHEMFTFVLGRQWSDDEEDMLKSFKKVPLQFNKLGTLINTMLGEQQQNTPQIEVNPLSNCNEQTASIRKSVTKDIMLSTDAKMVYQEAAKQAFVGGFGAFLIDTDYIHDKSFDVEIVYRKFKDASRCFWDMGAELPDKTDGMYCGYWIKMSRELFKKNYGDEVLDDILTEAGVMQTKAEIAAATDTDAADNPFSHDWADDDSMTLLHYYEREYEKDTLYKMSNGNVLNQAELKELIERTKEQRLEMAISGEIQEEDFMREDPDMMTFFDEGMPIRIEDKRPSRKSKITHYLICGTYVLEETEYPAEDLGLIFVDQNSYWDKNGKQICRPFIIDCIDAQRYINYLGTQAAFILKVSRYDQFLVSKKNVQGPDTQNIWRNPTSVQGGLIYDESPSGAKPEQLRPPELSASLSQQYQRAIEDLYTSTGLYPTRLGQAGNEVSGAAIDARTRQGSYPTYVAFNSLNNAITAGGKIVNQMIPRVYDTERVLSLMTPDEGRKNITINKPLDEYGEQVENDLRKGSFEVRLQAGPSYEGQKQEALNALNAVIQANPTFFNLIADLYAENLPLANTIEIRNRLKTIVPAQIIEAGKTGKMPHEMGQEQPSPEEQAQIAEVQSKLQQIEIKKQELQLKMQEQAQKAQRDQLEMEMKMLELASKLEEQKLRYLAETERTYSDNAISHANNLTKILTHKHDIGAANGAR